MYCEIPKFYNGTKLHNKFLKNSRYRCRFLFNFVNFWQKYVNSKVQPERSLIGTRLFVFPRDLHPLSRVRLSPRPRLALRAIRSCFFDLANCFLQLISYQLFVDYAVKFSDNNPESFFYLSWLVWNGELSGPKCYVSRNDIICSISRIRVCCTSMPHSGSATINLKLDQIV